MSSQSRVIQTGALPPNTTNPLPPGANNIYTAGIIKQNEQNVNQNTLVGNKQSGGKKLFKGGTQPPVVQVAATPSYAVNKTQTNDINTQIAELAVTNQNNSIFDQTVNGNQSDTAKLAAEQQAIYSGKGGAKRRLSQYKKGGAWPIWGCYSGGKKSSKNSRSKKNSRFKKRKTRKRVKRYHR